MSQFPVPSPLPGGGRPEGGGFSFNFSGINPYLQSLLGRWGEVMDIQTERLRAQPQRDEVAFQEWLRKRAFERDQMEREQGRADDAAKEAANTNSFNRAQVEIDRRNAETNCQALRQRGIPCAAPGGPGSTYGGSSEGGVASAKLGASPSVQNASAPAFGPRSGTAGAVVNNYAPTSGPGPQYLASAGGAAGIAQGSGVTIPDYWKTDAGADDQCQDSRGNWVPCRDL